MVLWNAKRTLNVRTRVTFEIDPSVGVVIQDFLVFFLFLTLLNLRRQKIKKSTTQTRLLKTVAKILRFCISAERSI